MKKSVRLVKSTGKADRKSTGKTRQSRITSANRILPGVFELEVKLIFDAGVLGCLSTVYLGIYGRGKATLLVNHPQN